jgi:hypothetical protein
MFQNLSRTVGGLRRLGDMPAEEPPTGTGPK